MRRDTTPDIVLEIEAPSTRSQTRKYIMLTSLKMMNQLIKDLEKKKNIPQEMRNVNSTGEDKDYTLIHFNIWIRRNAVSDTQNQYTGSQNQMMK